MKLICIATALLVGCGPHGTFDCSNDSQCGSGGRCEPTGYCSFIDEGCMSGWRYDRYAGNEFASACVGSSATNDAAVNSPNEITYVFGEAPAATHNNVTTDNYLLSLDNANYGGGDEIQVEDSDKRGLIRFDISAIGGGASVVSAMLTVFVTNADSGSAIQVRPLLESWFEGGLDGAAGTSNWSQRDTGSMAWATPGAGAPGSAGATATTFQPTAGGSQVIGLPISLVEGWVANPAQNRGVVLIASQGKLHFASSEGTANTRPLLTVTFVP